MWSFLWFDGIKNGCQENCAYVWVHSTAVFMVAMLISMEITAAFPSPLLGKIEKKALVFYDFYIRSQHDGFCMKILAW